MKGIVPNDKAVEVRHGKAIFDHDGIFVEVKDDDLGNSFVYCSQKCMLREEVK